MVWIREHEFLFVTKTRNLKFNFDLPLNPLFVGQGRIASCAVLYVFERHP